MSFQLLQSILSGNKPITNSSRWQRGIAATVCFAVGVASNGLQPSATAQVPLASPFQRSASVDSAQADSELNRQPTSLANLFQQEAAPSPPAPTDQAPTDQAPAGQAPADQAPADPVGESVPAGEGEDDTLREALELFNEDRQVPSLSDQVESPQGSLRSQSLFAKRTTSYSEEGFSLPTIAAPTTSKEQIGNGETPSGFRSGTVPQVMPLPESGADRGGMPWAWTVSHWAAADTFSHPLYFEDRMLERHGHRRFPHLQPMISGGRFAAQAFLLPYLVALHHPSECHYSLGYYRAGDCVPAFFQRPPWKRKAAVAQAVSTAVTATILP
jgi:hypothetical protein